MKMYEIGSFYRIEIRNTKNGSFYYTAQVIAEDETHLRLETARDEKPIIRKEDIIVCNEISENEFEAEKEKATRYRDEKKSRY